MAKARIAGMRRTLEAKVAHEIERHLNQPVGFERLDPLQRETRCRAVLEDPDDPRHGPVLEFLRRANGGRLPADVPDICTQDAHGSPETW